MLLLIVLALLAIVAFGVGFTIHWLFIVAAVLALIWLIALFTGGIAGRSGAPRPLHPSPRQGTRLTMNAGVACARWAAPGVVLSRARSLRLRTLPASFPGTRPSHAVDGGSF